MYSSPTSPVLGGVFDPIVPPYVRQFSVAYDFPVSDADATARFPKSPNGVSNAWHSTFQDGDHLIEFGSDDHGEVSINSLRWVPVPSGTHADARASDFIQPGGVGSPWEYSGYNAQIGVYHYNNHVEIFHPIERWWAKVYHGGRYDLTTQPATLTHRTSYGTDPATLETIPGEWSGPELADFARDDTTQQWFSAVGATGTVYNPMYDWSPAHDAWLIVGGASGGDTAYDGAWLLERNPNYPATQPQPWRFRNFTLTGKAEAGYVPRYQARNLGRFRGNADWMYIFGGREAQLSQSNTPSAGITQATYWWSKLAHRINIVTGELQRLPDMPMSMADGCVAYDPVLDVFLITGVPRHAYPLISRSGAMTDDAKIGFTEDPHAPGTWWNHDDFYSHGVVIFDPQNETYHDVTPSGYKPPIHALGGYRAANGKIYIRPGSGYYPAYTTPELWQRAYYYSLAITEL